MHGSNKCHFPNKSLTAILKHIMLLVIIITLLTLHNSADNFSSSSQAKLAHNVIYTAAQTMPPGFFANLLTLVYTFLNWLMLGTNSLT